LRLSSNTTRKAVREFFMLLEKGKKRNKDIHGIFWRYLAL
jgi:hypothetical protein